MCSPWLVLRAGYLGRQEGGRALPRLSDSAWEGFTAELQFPAAQTPLEVSAWCSAPQEELMSQGEERGIQLGSPF